MNVIRPTFNILIGLFLLICIGVHVVGLVTVYSDEPVCSHIIHTICYAVCLFAFLRPLKYSTEIYSVAAIYPFLYHANCAYMHYVLQGKFSPICVLVVMLMPLIGFWIWIKNMA